MLQLLTDARTKVQKVTHLNNRQKNAELSQDGVGWEDILDKAEELYRSMTIEGNVRWPPACNINDSKTPPNGFGATNLTQLKHNGHRNGKSRHNNGGQHKKPSGKKKFNKQPKTSWKNLLNFFFPDGFLC